MSGLPFRLACSLAFLLPIALSAQAPNPLAVPTRSQSGEWKTVAPPALDGLYLQPSNRKQDVARNFMLSRTVPGQSVAALRLRGMQQRMLVPYLLPSSGPWQPLGPATIVTPQFGNVTGRVTTIAIAPWDASGNTVYLGSTGGGVWRSTNAAASDASAVTWQPLTDNPPAFSGVNITALSMGAVSVQPGSTNTNAVVLAGTGDPNDVLDSYYGAGILRSADGGTTWSLITESRDGFNGGVTNYSFLGNAFSGFAWSTANPNLVVAAVTNSYDGFINNVNNSNSINVPSAINTAEAGLYYSTDAGQTWFLSTIEDGPNKTIQSSQVTDPQVFSGVPVSSVVWNPIRRMFFAGVQRHGYYQSPDGVTWVRMLNQPGTALRSNNCPITGSSSCAIYRGVLAVQPSTGDMFALTVDVNNADQGLWQDVCNAGANGCANPVVQFGIQIPDTDLDDTGGNGTIPQGTYNLALAAVPNGTDTLLFAGTEDIFRCSLAAGCQWRDTTNAASCASAQVAAGQHAMDFLAAPAGQTQPLIYFGNDGGLWRSTDGVGQGSGPTCAPSDANHYQNLNGGLGSLGEVTGLADSPSDASVLLGGFGVNGSAAATNLNPTAWPQLLGEEGGRTAIDSANPDYWYATRGPGVAIGQCTLGTSCTTVDFGSQPAIGSTETSGDEALLYAPYALDTQDSTNMIVGTCRIWRGPAVGGSTWTAANAISPMLDGTPEPSCNGNALIRSLAAGGANVQSSTGPQNSGAQVIYAGMAGLLDGGGARVSGHVFATHTANVASGSTAWTDLALSPVANEQSYNGVFNPYRFDISSLYVDPHDSTGNTVYAAVQGYGVPHLYLSTNGGANWTNITKNLPDLPLNDVLVDPNDASVVYAASDGGVFVTHNVSNCMVSPGQCWNILGTGLPLAPAVKLAITAADGGYLRVGTYGRGVWQTQLLSGVPQTMMTLTPASLTFGGQQLQTASSPETVTVTNTGSIALSIGSIITTGDFLETNNCGGSVSAGNACQVQVTFSPSATGIRTGSLTVNANIAGGQQSVVLTGTGTTQPAFTILPNNVQFSDQQIGTTSPAQQVTISNSSGSPIALTSETVTGPFAIQINSCSNILPPNTGCTLAIVFQPTQSGNASGVLTVMSAQGTQTIGLAGNGENAATDTLTPGSLTFSATLENTSSAAQTVTLTNSGGLPLTGIQVQTIGDFAVVDGCSSSLSAQSSCTLTVRYTPHSAGAETGTIVVTDSLRTQFISLTGTGTAPATDTISPASLMFPATPIGQSASTQTVTVTNSGDVALSQLSVQTIGNGFTESNGCGNTVAAHTNCVITVVFQPQSVGRAIGQLDVTDSMRTQVVGLSGSGETPAEDNLSPTSLNFGQQTVGTTSAAQTVTLSNNGHAPLTGIQLQSANPDFVFAGNCPASLQPGAHCNIQIVFIPHTTGPDTGYLNVIDVNRTQQVPLNGTGTLANVTLTPANLTFGSVGAGLSSAPQTLLLSNGSSSTLTGIVFNLPPPFVETDNCGSTLLSGGTCLISVVFSPTATGSQNAALTLSSSNTGTMTTQVSGTGIAYTLSPTSPTNVSVRNGQAAGYSLELIPVSGSAGNVMLSCSNAPPNTTCTVNPQTASLLAPTNIQVTIATGVGTASFRAAPGSAARIARAGIGDCMPWLAGFLLLPLWFFRCNKRYPARCRHLLAILIVAGMMAGMTACGKGGGLLGVPNPLPGNSMTPPGTYTVSVTAAAGGLQKSVSLTLQVQ